MDHTRGRTTAWRRTHLRPLYDPRSIAVIGASPRPESFGARTAANLAGFAGRVFLVNDKYDHIGGIPCFPRLDALPEVPDLAVITTPASSVEEIVGQCIAAGVRSAIVYASGFAELGTPDAVAAQDRIVARAAQAGMRLLGPNCVGLLNYTSNARITFAAVPERSSLAPGAVGLVSQSGALGLALAQAIERGVSLSHVLTSGNAGDVDTADWVAALAEDPACAAIACVFEGLARPRRLLDAARLAWARDKPLVVFKLATGETGAAAAMSHTGSLAGSDASWRALLAEAGAIVVPDYEDLIETAAFFGKVGRRGSGPRAPGVAVLAGSGGAAILGADCADRHGVALPQPRDDARAVLESRIPAFGAPRNPCDVTAQVISDPEALMACAGALLADPGYGALVYGWTYAYATATARLPRFSALARQHGKPVCAVWLPQLLEGPGAAEIEADPDVAMFRSMDRCFAALSAWTARGARMDQATAPAPGPRPDLPDLPPGAAVLGEAGMQDMLRRYGVTVPRSLRVTDAAAAAAAWRTLGGQVALKIDSPDIPHKTEAGGVMLGVADADAASQAFTSIMRSCARFRPDARLDGVLVTEMVPAGVEIIVGVRNDPGFGPVLVAGLGGVLAELVRDTVTALAPVDEAQALALLSRLRAVSVLDGFRGGPKVDRAALARTISRISHLACDLGDRLQELDINPLICRGSSVVAVDGLAVLSVSPASAG